MYSLSLDISLFSHFYHSECPLSVICINSSIVAVVFSFGIIRFTKFLSSSHFAHRLTRYQN